MLASSLVKKMGKRLVGRKVKTPAMGEYPGGIATVIEVGHDKNAPEISFMVEHPTWKDDEGNSEMGVFEYEAVTLIDGRKTQEAQ